MSPSRARAVPLAAVLADLQQVAARLGHPWLSRRTYAAHGQYSATAMARKVGSWRALVLLAGLEPGEVHQPYSAWHRQPCRRCGREVPAWPGRWWCKHCRRTLRRRQTGEGGIGAHG